jgi:hypothetical protein
MADIEVIVDPAAISTAVTVDPAAVVASVTLATGAPGPQGEQGPAGADGSDASVTSANIIAALGYTPADAATAGNSFNQSLNTTDSPAFAALTVAGSVTLPIEGGNPSGISAGGATFYDISGANLQLSSGGLSLNDQSNTNTINLNGANGAATFASGAAGFDASGNLTATNFSPTNFDQSLNTTDSPEFANVVAADTSACQTVIWGYGTGTNSQGNPDGSISLFDRPNFTGFPAAPPSNTMVAVANDLWFYRSGSNKYKVLLASYSSTSDVLEGANLYFTNARAQSATRSQSIAFSIAL